MICMSYWSPESPPVAMALYRLTLQINRTNGGLEGTVKQGKQKVGNFMADMQIIT